MSYAVTGSRNSESKHWRGQLRGYAVTAFSKCVRVCAYVRRVWVDFAYRGVL
ncbi:MAG: hypothetical protein K0R58_12 [Ramlibacter sp.]|jgi:hypothetical protein|nr:hypothetical protein [Ramlibacter sp.]